MWKFGQIQFVFPTFLSTERKLLHAVFFTTRFFTLKTEKESARALTCNLVFAPQRFLQCALQGPKRQKLQDFRLSGVLGAAKRATKFDSSALGLCFARQTILQQFPGLLLLTTPVVLVDFLPFFPLFSHFHYKSNLFYPKEPWE